MLRSRQTDGAFPRMGAPTPHALFATAMPLTTAVVVSTPWPVLSEVDIWDTPKIRRRDVAWRPGLVLTIHLTA